MATVVEAEDVKAYAPDMSIHSDERIELFIEFANSWVNEGQWGAKFKLAIILMTCHLLTMAARNGAGGAVASEKVGDLSVTYTQGNPDDTLGTTSHGQTFQQLKRTIKKTPLVV